MNRIANFKALESHAWFGPMFERLSVDELAFCFKYLEQNIDVGYSQFEIQINRMFVDQAKPKRWKEILELLSACNHPTNSKE